MLEESLVSSTVVASVVLKALSSELSWVGAKAGRREPSSVRSKVVHSASQTVANWVAQLECCSAASSDYELEPQTVGELERRRVAESGTTTGRRTVASTASERAAKMVHMSVAWMAE